MDAPTVAKIHQIDIRSDEGRAMIRNMVDPAVLPKDLGGDFVGNPLEDLPLEKELRNYVQNLVEKRKNNKII